jgi:hypothetical protein
VVVVRAVDDGHATATDLAIQPEPLGEGDCRG